MNQKGFVPVILLIGIAIASLGAVIVLKNNSSTPEIKRAEIQATESANLDTPVPTSQDSSPPKTSPTPSTAKASPKSSPLVSVSPDPATQATPHPVTAYGFAYEDQDNNGQFTNGEPKLPNMMFYIYDSVNPKEQISTVHAGADGRIFIRLNVKGKMVLKPMQWLSYTPKTGPIEFSEDNANFEAKFGFRSTSDPSPEKVGVLEGDFYNDSNENGAVDAGEERIYFYKLYLKDENDGHYYTVDGAQATDPSGHFKYVGLPVNKSYRLVLSTLSEYYKVYQTEYSFNFSSTNTSITDIKIPVVQK